MIVFSLVGWSGSGKTVLASRLISHFKNKGLTIAAIKKVPHEYSFQPEGKDSRRFLEMGADLVCLAGETETVSIKPVAGESEIQAMIQSEFRMFDVILLEGLVLNNSLVAEVYDSETNDRLKFPREKLAFVVSDHRHQGSLPWFHRDDIQGIAEYVEVMHHEQSKRSNNNG